VARAAATSLGRLRQAANVDDLYSVLLDVTVPFCEQAAVPAATARPRSNAFPMIELISNTSVCVCVFDS